MKKNRGPKSRWTVPLSSGKYVDINTEDLFAMMEVVVVVVCSGAAVLLREHGPR